MELKESDEEQKVKTNLQRTNKNVLNLNGDATPSTPIRTLTNKEYIKWRLRTCFTCKKTGHGAHHHINTATEWGVPKEEPWGLWAKERTIKKPTITLRLNQTQKVKPRSLNTLNTLTPKWDPNHPQNDTFAAAAKWNPTLDVNNSFSIKWGKNIDQNDYSYMDIFRKEDKEGWTIVGKQGSKH
ncbi:hypothetical protein MD484_g8921, partial [Candolleomyces efflorescens]